MIKLLLLLLPTLLSAQTWSFSFDKNQNLVLPNSSGTPTTRFTIGVYDTSGYGGTVHWWVGHLNYVLAGDSTVNTPATGMVDLYFQGISGTSIFTINTSETVLNGSNGHSWQPHSTLFWTVP